MRLAIVQNNERPDICGPCGGKCCKRAPGVYLPNQWKSKDDIAAAIRSNACAVVEFPIFGNEDVSYYVLRAQTSNRLTFGQCGNLTESGCKLSFNDRPWECQQLTPKADGRCGDADGPTNQEIGKIWQESEFNLLEIKVGLLNSAARRQHETT